MKNRLLSFHSSQNSEDMASGNCSTGVAELTHPVEVNDLPNYIRIMTGSGGFKEQYSMMKTGQLKPWETGKRLANKMKNRYTELLPYDETRVILDPLPNECDSDYINANYIPGYKKSKAYISTQGPLDRTVNDFWRMIWQEVVSSIVMAANVIEDGKKKCEKYWPDKSTNYGEITVTLISEQIFVDYTVRAFQLKKNSRADQRQVTQYHFTGWPDHGVPSYALSLVQMLQTANRAKKSTSPMVLHCSAGVGRSGTVMLLDSALQMATEEGRVDFLKLLNNMRQSRINLVETVEQFTFVHQAVAEFLFGDVTRQSCDQLEAYWKKLNSLNMEFKKSWLEIQFERVRKLTPAFELPNFLKESEKNCVSKCSKWEWTDVDSPLYLNGYGRRHAYIATGFPHKAKAQELWQVVHENGCQSLVILGVTDDVKEGSYFWPETGSLCHGDYLVEHMNTELTNGVLIRDCNLYKIGQTHNMRSMKLFQVMGVTDADSDLEHILTVLKEVNRWQANTGSKTILVISPNSLSACGRFCGSAFLLDMLKTEGAADVFLATRTLRFFRPQLVPTLDHYRWLYEVARALAKDTTFRFSASRNR